MDENMKSAQSKFEIIQYALETKNISKTCQLFGISRTIYYKWYNNYRENGIEALANKNPRKPQMPNQVDQETEKAILEYVVKYPSDGPKKIYAVLREAGFTVGETGIYKVLKRNKLNQRSQRELFSMENRLRDKGKRCKEKLDCRFEDCGNAYPGYIVLQSLNFIGRYENVGKVYQYCLYDAYSKWGFVKLFNSKMAIDTAEAVQSRLLPMMKTFEQYAKNLVTNNTEEFERYWEVNSRSLKNLRNRNIRHWIYPHENREAMKLIHDFLGVLSKEFYGKRLKACTSFCQLEKCMEMYMRHYNFSREITKGHNKGLIPANIILDHAAKDNLDLTSLSMWLQTEL